jgi:hypothetical protein
MPKDEAKKVLASGICACPPSESAANSRSASASSAAVSDSAKPWKLGWPVHRPSDASSVESRPRPDRTRGRGCPGSASASRPGRRWRRGRTPRPPRSDRRRTDRAGLALASLLGVIAARWRPIRNRARAAAADAAAPLPPANANRSSGSNVRACDSLPARDRSEVMTNERTCSRHTRSDISRGAGKARGERDWPRSAVEQGQAVFERSDVRAAQPPRCSTNQSRAAALAWSKSAT